MTARILPRVAGLAVAYAGFVAAWWGLDWVSTHFLAEPFIRPFNRAAFVDRPLVVGAWVLGVVLVLRIVWLATRKGPHRFGTARWNSALEAAGLIKDPAGKDAKPAPRARMVGRVRVVDETTLALLRLPPGLAVSQVQARADRVAAFLDVPTERLHLSRHEGRPGMLAIRLDPPARALKPRTPDLGLEDTRWRDPVLLGRDRRGRDVTAPTYDVGQWLAGGRTGSGKTTLLRLLAAHFALDPTAAIWGCDGKGSRDDWGPLMPRVARWVDVTDPTAGDDYLTMLRDLAQVILSRNAQGGRDHPGMLVLFEEATVFRAGLDQAQTTEADKLMTRIVQTCRSANVLVVTAAQRPAASLMSTNVRAQAGVAWCGMVRSDTDREMVLGYRPEIVAPEAPGWGLLDTGDGTPRVVLVDWMPNEVWADLCTMWTPPPPRLVVGDGPQDAPDDEDETDPLLSAVAHVLVASQHPLAPSDLWGRLPAELRTASVEKMGKALSALGVTSKRRTVEGSQMRTYALSDLTIEPSSDKSDSTVPQDAVGP